MISITSFGQHGPKANWAATDLTGVRLDRRRTAESQIAGYDPARPEGPADLVGCDSCQADYLLTGDARHFEHFYGKRIKGCPGCCGRHSISNVDDAVESAGFALLPCSFGDSID
jgi:hypothetical protein